MGMSLRSPVHINSDLRTFMKQLLQAAAIFLLLFTLNSQLSTVRAQGTAFTYQGRLNNSGSSAAGTYDFRFRLSADALGNTVLATTFTNGIPITNGLFTTTLDFGPGFFNGSNYWLEVDVRTNGAGTYVALTPLQPLTPAPYAVFANTASNLSGVLPAAQISGTVASANLSGTYGNTLTLNNTNNAFNGTFSGSGANVTGVNAASLNGLNKTNFWQTSGNSGTTSGANFLGTTDNQPLEFWVNNQRGLRLQPGNVFSAGLPVPPGLQGATSLVGGLNQNSIAAGVQGATIAGGGDVEFFNFGDGSSTNFNHNTISGSFGTADGATISGGIANSVNDGRAATVSGGENNTAGNSDAVVAGGTFNSANGDTATVGGGQNNQANGRRGTVPGGDSNIAAGRESFAAGRGAQANFDSDFVWADSFGQAGLPVTFASTGIDQFLIRAGGGVGIGTTTPRHQLDVNGNIFLGTAQSGAVFTEIGDTLYLGAPMKYLSSKLGAQVEGTTDWLNLMCHPLSHGIMFGTAGPSDADPHSAPNPLMVIQPGGNVGIGITAPGKKLEVAKSVSAVGAGSSIDSSVLLRLDNTASDGNTSSPDFAGIGFGQNSTRQAIVGGTFGNDYLDFYTGGVLTAPKVRIDFNGRVGIGTAAPTQALHVIGNILASGTITGSSDRNVKTNFASISPTDVLEKVAGLPITRWNYDADLGVAHIGPMAQDFYAAFNVGMDDRHISMVDADGVALAAIQGLNEKLEVRSQKLEAENVELKARLEKLERLLVAKVGGDK